MITNMVYPDEINNEIYNEIREETEKYGTVNDIKFFQFHITENEVNIPIEESVRVFIEYERLVEWNKYFLVFILQLRLLRNSMIDIFQKGY